MYLFKMYTLPYTEKAQEGLQWNLQDLKQKQTSKMTPQNLKKSTYTIKTSGCFELIFILLSTLYLAWWHFHWVYLYCCDEIANHL